MEIKNRTQLMAFVDRAESLVAKYGWQDRLVHPYSYGVKVSKVLSDLGDYDRCTPGSKSYLISLARGFSDVIDAWEENEKKPHVSVRIIKSGKVMRILEEDLDCFEGLVEVVG